MASLLQRRNKETSISGVIQADSHTTTNGHARAASDRYKGHMVLAECEEAAVLRKPISNGHHPSLMPQADAEPQPSQLKAADTAAAAQTPGSSGSGKRVVIIGAGPAGLVAAAFLARDGHDVHVLEKRPDPTVYDEAANRTWVIVMSPRGLQPLKELGVRLPEDDWLDGLTRVYGSVAHLPNGKDTTREWLSGAAITFERGDLAAHLVAEVRRLYPSVTFSFQTKIQQIDLKDRSLVAERPDQAAQTLKYDLLVGSDGAGSQVRGIMEAQVPGFKATRTFCNSMATVVRDLPADVVPKSMSEPVAGKASGGAGRWVHFALAVPPFSDKQPFRNSVFWLTQAGTYAAILGMDCGLQLPEDPSVAEEQLLSALPRLPKEWCPIMAKHAVTAKWYSLGSTISSSRLALPELRVALIGDAAHGVTPRMGQGLNSAMETAAIFSKAVVEHPESLEEALRSYEEVRTDDAQALAYLDLRSEYWFRLASWRQINVAYLETCANILLSGTLHKLAPRIFRPSVMLSLFSPQATQLPYTYVKWQRRRDLLILSVVMAASVCGAAWGVAKSAGVLDLSFSGWTSQSAATD